MTTNWNLRHECQNETRKTKSCSCNGRIHGAPVGVWWSPFSMALRPFCGICVILMEGLRVVARFYSCIWWAFVWWITGQVGLCSCSWVWDSPGVELLWKHLELKTGGTTGDFHVLETDVNFSSSLLKGKWSAGWAPGQRALWASVWDSSRKKIRDAAIHWAVSKPANGTAEVPGTRHPTFTHHWLYPLEPPPSICLTDQS